jgi:hypothetical protein
MKIEFALISQKHRQVDLTEASTEAAVVPLLLVRVSSYYTSSKNVKRNKKMFDN